MLFAAAVYAALRRRRERRSSPSPPPPPAPSLACMLREEVWLVVMRLARRVRAPAGALGAAVTGMVVILLLGDMTPGPVAAAPVRYGLALLSSCIVLLSFDAASGRPR